MGENISREVNTLRLIVGAQLDLLNAIHLETKAGEDKRYHAARRVILDEFNMELLRLSKVDDDVHED